MGSLRLADSQRRLPEPPCWLQMPAAGILTARCAAGTVTRMKAGQLQLAGILLTRSGAAVPRMILTQAKARQSLPRRRTFTAAADGPARAATFPAFHAVAPALGPGAGTEAGVPAMARTVLAAGRGQVRSAFSDGPVPAAVSGPARQPAGSFALEPRSAHGPSRGGGPLLRDPA